MKKFALALGGMLLPMLAMAEYNSMQFESSDGGNHYIDISGLEISFADHTLTASNAETTLTLPLNQVVSMQFSNSPGSEVKIVEMGNTDAIEVYSASGISLGSYKSLTEVRNDVPSGIFVVRYSDGTTLKLLKK